MSVRSRQRSAEILRQVTEEAARQWDDRQPVDRPVFFYTLTSERQAAECARVLDELGYALRRQS